MLIRLSLQRLVPASNPFLCDSSHTQVGTKATNAGGPEESKPLPQGMSLAELLEEGLDDVRYLEDPPNDAEKYKGEAASDRPWH